MPVSPDDGAAHAAAVGDIAARVELWLLEQLAEVLRTGADRDDWADQVLTRIRFWRARTDQGVAGAMDELQAAVADALLAASTEGHALALVDLPDNAVRRPPPPARAVLVSADTLGEAIATSLRQTPRLLERILRETVAAGAREVTGGKVTRLQAAQHTLDRLVGRGITGFRDTAGRNWSLTSYVEMAVRTETGRVAVDAHMDALANAGQDLVEISDSPRECPACRPWERKILSLSGQVGAMLLPSATGGDVVRITVAGTLQQARDAGLFHPNCTHRAKLFVPGVARKPAEHDPEGYEAKQRQRAIERHIRDWKRRESIALDEAAAARARAKVREWQAALRDHIDEHDLKRLRRREQIDFAR